MNTNYPKCLFDLNNDILEIIEKNIRYKRTYDKFVKVFEDDLWLYSTSFFDPSFFWKCIDSNNKKYYFIIAHISEIRLEEDNKTNYDFKYPRKIYD